MFVYVHKNENYLYTNSKGNDRVFEYTLIENIRQQPQ